MLQRMCFVDIFVTDVDAACVADAAVDDGDLAMVTVIVNAR